MIGGRISSQGGVTGNVTSFSACNRVGGMDSVSCSTRCRRVQSMSRPSM